MEDRDAIITSDDRKRYPVFVYVALRNALTMNKESLRQSADKNDLAEVAWRARNLLELMVWTEYCVQDLTNAQSFYEDAIRDLVDMNRNRPGLDDETRERLSSVVATLADPSKPHKYKRVGDVAHDLQIALYEDNFKTLSKFAHPTAMSVIAPLGDDALKRVIANIVAEASSTADESLSRLDSSPMAEMYKELLPIMQRFGAVKLITVATP